MHCPNCGQEQFCPCSACRPRHKQKIMWKHDETGILISCGKCGFTATADWWENLAMEIYRGTKNDSDHTKDSKKV